MEVVDVWIVILAIPCRMVNVWWEAITTVWSQAMESVLGATVVTI